MILNFKIEWGSVIFIEVAKDLPSKALTTSQRLHAMLPLGEASEEKYIVFNWGRKRGTGGPNKNNQFYESFTYDGVKYSLDDCVYMWHENESNPYIGKLVKIWETANHKKIVKVVWFFRPIEIQDFLGDVEVLQNEVFLASGEGKGLFNLNYLEAICGKCNVVCTSKDKRNPRASNEELRMADYIFYRTFDVGSCRISHSFADVIAGTEVKHFFNRGEDRKLISSELGANLKEKSANTSSSLKVEGVMAVRNPVKDGKPDISVKQAAKVSAESKLPVASLGKQTWFRDENTADKPKASIDKIWSGDVRIPCSQVADKSEMKHSDNLGPTSLSDTRPLKKRKVQFSTDPAKLSDTLPRLPDLRAKSLDALDSGIEKLEMSKGVKFHEKSRKISDASASQIEQERGINTDSQILEVTRRPGEHTSKWFKERPWEERMQRAHEKGTIILLENLDASYTSSEVEDIVWHAFNAKVDAKMIQHSAFSSPHYGQAFVIFKTKDAAELAISELNRKCLMLTNGRPVVGCKRSPKKLSDPNRFVGHLILDRIRSKQSEETRKAVSTSHYSQPNTIEYDMALEWRVLQERSNLWWGALNEQQAKEMEDLRSKLRIHHDG